MSKLLYDDHPIMVSPRLATLIGLNEAVVLQQVHYWLEINKAAKKNHKEGTIWCFNSYEEWQKSNFPFWTLRTVKTIFSRLHESGLLRVGRFNRLKWDRTNWYTIDYVRLSELELAPIVQSLHDAKDHSCTMQGVNFAPTIPETTEETSEQSEPSEASSLSEPTPQQVEKGGQEKMDTHDTMKQFYAAKEKKPRGTSGVLNLWIKWKDALWNKTGEQQMHNPTGKELGQLKHLLNKCGVVAVDVMTFAVLNWEKFVFRAAIDNGLKTVPKKPNLGFLLENVMVAATMFNKAGAPLPVEAAPTPASAAIDKPAAIVETPITPEQQLAFLKEMGIEINV